MKLTRRFPAELAGESLDRVEQVFEEVRDLERMGCGGGTARVT